MLMNFIIIFHLGNGYRTTDADYLKRHIKDKHPDKSQPE